MSRHSMMITTLESRKSPSSDQCFQPTPQLGGNFQIWGGNSPPTAPPRKNSTPEIPPQRHRILEKFPPRFWFQTRFGTVFDPEIAFSKGKTRLGCKNFRLRRSNTCKTIKKVSKSMIFQIWEGISGKIPPPTAHPQKNSLPEIPPQRQTPNENTGIYRAPGAG